VAARRGIVLVIVILSTAVLISGAGVLVLLLAGGSAPRVQANSTVHLDLVAPLPEIERTSVLAELLPQQPPLRAVVSAIQRAADDERVAALVIRPRTAGALWGQVQELRAALQTFRDSGKPLIAYMDQASTLDYYLASVADRLLLMPAGQLDLTGVASYELFFRGTLDKIGVYPDLLHVGQYKTASNTFTETGFTDAHREMTASMNDSWLTQMVQGIAAARNMIGDDVRRAIDGGPYTAADALAAGLVDGLAYADEIQNDERIRGTRRLDGETYLRALVPPAGRERIALLYATGTITSGESVFDSPTGVVLGSETFTDWLRQVRLDSSILAVVVRIDSPGGSAIASEAIWRELMLTEDVKPVIVSMGDVAASGGYYIAAPARRIVAEPGTITGSIGVVTGKFVLDGLADELGVGVGSVSSGPAAEMYSPFSRFSDVARERIERQMQTTYDLFVSRVADGRHLEPEQVHALGQGRVWTGEQALERGLVDELGGLDAAIRNARQAARIDPARDVSLVVYPARRSLYEVLANPFGRAALGTRDLWRSPETYLAEVALARLRLFRQGEPLALMPNVFWRN